MTKLQKLDVETVVRIVRAVTGKPVYLVEFQKFDQGEEFISRLR